MTLLSNFQTEFTYMFNSFKEAVTVTSLSRSKNSESDTTEVESDTSTYAMIEYLTDIIDREGYANVQDADIMAIFLPTESISLKDEVVHNSVEYEVTNITAVGVAGTTIYQEATLNKKN